MVEPAIGPEELVHEGIEVFVMAELHVTAEVPREAILVDDGPREASRHRIGLDKQPVLVPAGVQPPRCAKSGRPGPDE